MAPLRSCLLRTLRSARRALQQAQQFRGQRSKLGSCYGTLRMYDDVPSCGYLLAVAAHDFAGSPANAIARDRAAKLSLDAESKTALRQIIGAEEHSEV